MIRGDLKFVPVDEVVENDYNPNSMSNEMLEKEKRSLELFGLVRPIITRTEKGRHVIVDGEHRWRLLKEANIHLIPIRDLGEITEQEAKELTVTVNGIHGTVDFVKLMDLFGGMSMSDEKVASVTPWSPDEVRMMREANQLGGVGNFDFGDSGEENDDRCIKFVLRLLQSEVGEFRRKAMRLCERLGLGIDKKEGEDVRLGRLAVFLMRKNGAISLSEV